MILLFLLLIPLCLAWNLPCSPPSTDDIPIPIGVFVPQGVSPNGSLLSLPSSLDLADFTGVEGSVGDFLPAIHLALHHIREHSCLLSGFYLHFIYKSTQCNPSLGMKALFDVIASKPRPVAVFGGQCTTVNEPIAMALKYWQIVQLSYAETHPKFSSADTQELYPTFFRVVAAFRNTNEAKSRLISHFKWTRVGTVRQSDESRYSLPHEKLTTLLEHNGVQVIYTAGITHHEVENIGSELEELKRRDTRIFVVDVAQDMAAIVLCEAYRRDLRGDNYVWILPGYHKKRWEHYDGINCTKEQLDSVLEGHFAIEFATRRKMLSVVTPSGKTAGQVLEELSHVGGDSSIWSTFLYDGLWTLAFALKQAYSGDDGFSFQKMMWGMTNTSFEGITGRVRFEGNERLGIADILQYQKGRYRLIGKYDGTDRSFELEKDKLEGWSAPLDATIVERRREHISTSLLVTFSSLAALGILISTLFLLVNIRYRNHRFIKMSSPNLNNIVIIGSMCTYASVILIGIDTRIITEAQFEKLCYARAWILCLGFTLAFGSMFSKTWRVHSIFTNIRMDKKAIKDSKLFLMLGILLLLDVVVLSFWAFFSPFHLSITELPRISAVNRLIIPEVVTCQSDNSVIFQAILYVVKGILMILGCFLAWETRHVNVPALNDSKYIGMSVYNVVVMSVLGLSVAFILQDRVNEAYALSCLFIIFSTTLTLCLLFVPKLVELIRNPEGIEPKGYRRGLMKSVVTKQKNVASPHSMDSEKDLLARAESENALKHRILQEKSNQLWDMLQRLRELGDTTLINHEVGPSNPSEEWPWSSDPDQPSTML